MSNMYDMIPNSYQITRSRYLVQHIENLQFVNNIFSRRYYKNVKI